MQPYKGMINMDLTSSAATKQNKTKQIHGRERGKEATGCRCVDTQRGKDRGVETIIWEGRYAPLIPH